MDEIGWAMKVVFHPSNDKSLLDSSSMRNSKSVPKRSMLAAGNWCKYENTFQTMHPESPPVQKKWSTNSGKTMQNIKLRTTNNGDNEKL